MVIFHDTREDVRCRYDSITTAGLAKDDQCFTLQLNAQLLIGIVGIQDLEGRKIGSETIDRVMERELAYVRDDVDEFLSALLC